MRKRFMFALSLSLALGVISTSTDPAHGQEREVIIERILNPLPDFDPFEKPPAPPQFFPDAVDKRARELLIDAVTNRKEAIEEHVKFFTVEDRRLQKQHGSSTGLTEHAQDLVNNTIPDRERYLAGAAAGSKEELGAATQKVSPSNHR